VCLLVVIGVRADGKKELIAVSDGCRESSESRSRPTTAPSGPRATAKITEHLDDLLAFYDYPAEHWIHLRTTNPIESTFATVRLRQRVTKGPGSRAAGVAMAFKLIESAQARWRA
jgi:putative transposase